jgi:hypothetical protein
MVLLESFHTFFSETKTLSRFCSPLKREKKKGKKREKQPLKINEPKPKPKRPNRNGTTLWPGP